MHFLRAYIASIVILASWCMHHWASIMVIALCHMHHFSRAWNPPFSCCTIIAIIHLNSASWSWLYIDHCTLNWSILSWFLDCIITNSLIASLFCNQHHPNYLDNKLWAGMSRTSLINLSYYFRLLSISFVMNVADIIILMIVISILWELDRLSLSSLVKLIHIQSIHAFVILISSYFHGFYYQHQPFLVWLLFVTFDGWFTSLPFRVFRPNLGTRFFLGGEAVTVHVFVMLDIYIVSIKLMCVGVKLLKI
jgi:hypothetical protein